MVADEPDKKIKAMLKAVTDMAKADNKITPEEAEIINSIHVNVMIYDQALDNALDDGIITQDEKETLEALKMQILNDAWSIAEISDGVNDDELKLLDVLLKELGKE